MSLPYQRNSESTRSSASSYFAGTHSPPPSQSTPTWKSTKKGRVNSRRLISYLGAIAGVILVFTLITKLFGHSRVRQELGLSTDGRMNTKYVRHGIFIAPPIRGGLP